jgi:hypothetical protein
MTWRYGMHYRAAAAEAALAGGDLARAQEHVHALQAGAERTRSRRYLVRAGRLLAACRTASGDPAGAEALLARTVAEAHALGNPVQRWQSLLEHGRVLAARGRRDAAAAAGRDALALADAAVARLPDEVRRAFEGSRWRASLAEALAAWL